jgi:hypothetical protein
MSPIGSVLQCAAPLGSCPALPATTSSTKHASPPPPPPPPPPLHSNPALYKRAWDAGRWNLRQPSELQNTCQNNKAHVTRHTSHVTRHTSHATRHTSHVTHLHRRATTLLNTRAQSKTELVTKKLRLPMMTIQERQQTLHFGRHARAPHRQSTRGYGPRRKGMRCHKTR